MRIKSKIKMQNVKLRSLDLNFKRFFFHSFDFCSLIFKFLRGGLYASWC